LSDALQLLGDIDFLWTAVVAVTVLVTMDAAVALDAVVGLTVTRYGTVETD
jgi:hypothetical protein